MTLCLKECSKEDKEANMHISSVMLTMPKDRESWRTGLWRAPSITQEERPAYLRGDVPELGRSESWEAKWKEDWGEGIGVRKSHVVLKDTLWQLR